MGEGAGVGVGAGAGAADGVARCLPRREGCGDCQGVESAHETDAADGGRVAAPCEGRVKRGSEGPARYGVRRQEA